MATIKTEDILKAIEDMSVMELVELISAIEESSVLLQQLAVAAGSAAADSSVKQQLKIKMSLMLCYQQQVIKKFKSSKQCGQLLVLV